ncbi:taste receptor type 2 member 16 [Thomomys bottae]
MVILTIIFIFIYVLESLTIIFQSSFVIAVLGREWVQAKRLSPLGMIFTSLNICRFCLQLLSMVYNFCSFMYPHKIFWIIAVGWEFTNTASIWLTSLLAVFYCAKVCSFTHPLFFWLRWRVLRLVPQLILGTLVISFVTTILATVRTFIWLELTPREHLLKNRSLIEGIKMFDLLYPKPQKVIVLLIPFLLFLVSISLLITSMIQHWKQSQHSKDGGSGHVSRKAQRSALRSLAIFLICFTSYILSVLISFLGILHPDNWFWAWEVVIYATVTVHSTLLMLSNPTVKKVVKIRCWGSEAA